MEDPDTPPSRAPPPPPKKLSRPKITLQIPEVSVMPPKGPATSSTIHWGPKPYQARPPGTAGSHLSDHTNPYFNPFVHMYHNKASDFMFKQFEGFKDFTMNTAKSGLSAGEKSAFWFVSKLRSLSKKWFTHLFLSLCLVLYSLLGALMFMALEGPQEQMVKYEKNFTYIRSEFATKLRDTLIERHLLRTQDSTALNLLSVIESNIKSYEKEYAECQDFYNDDGTVKKRMWTFWNSAFYAGTLYTTIDVRYGLDTKKEFISGLRSHTCCWRREGLLGMQQKEEDNDNLNIRIPTITADSETQTTGHLVSKSPDNRLSHTMETSQEPQNISLRKRRNLSKNRGQGARQREKTPDPGRNVYEDTTTSDDEEFKPQRSSREIEADKTYEEMRRMVQEKSTVKDPVYDVDLEEIQEKRAMAANERRRRSVSPFAIPDREEISELERKGSFINPTNKLLSTTYTLSPKEEDTGRRNSLTIETPKERKNSLSPTSPLNLSPKESGFPYPIPTTPKKLEKMIYPDETEDKTNEDSNKQLKTPVKDEPVFTFEEQTELKPVRVSSIRRKSQEPPSPAPGEIVTKVIQVERTPSKKLPQDLKPKIETRDRVVRTPSRKMSTDIKPVLVPRQITLKQETQPPQPKLPPVKPARSKSASRFGGRTSESEMSEDQGNLNVSTRRKVVPTPRRFLKKSSPRANRSQSVARVEDIKVIDKTGTGMSQTSQEIIELMQKARARSLSIPKDDPKLPEYAKYQKTLQTPNKTPVSRRTRGISCPKTIQIISNQEILSGLIKNKPEPIKADQNSRQSSGYIDASQSEYTSSCYSTSPSENEYEFDLAERTAELTRKLNELSEDAFNKEKMSNILLSNGNVDPKSVLRKRSTEAKRLRKESITTEKKQNTLVPEKLSKPLKSRWKFIANWQEFRDDHKFEYDKLKSLSNKCICDTILLVILCGLGGMTFKTLEGSFENAYKCGTRNVKRDFIEHLWRGSHYLKEEDWKSMARNKLYEFENQLHTAHEAGVTSFSGQHSWNFMNSFVYCLTIITTIGYGHIAPTTVYGRAATIIYAIIGIPLFLIVLADFGKLFTRIIKFFWAFIRRFYYTRSCRKVRRTGPVQEVMKGFNIVYDAVRRPSQIFSEEDIKEAEEGPPIERKASDVPPPLPPKPGQQVEPETAPDTPAPTDFEIDDEFNLPISLAIVILIIYIIIGAVGFKIWERQWTFFESFYFVFISMSTIGLGDMVPNHPIFMMASILYLVFGLALTSMCINVVQLKLSNTFKQASAKLGATIGLKVSEDDGSLIPITPAPIENVPVHKTKTELEEQRNKDSQKETNKENEKSK